MERREDWGAKVIFIGSLYIPRKMNIEPKLCLIEIYLEFHRVRHFKLRYTSTASIPTSEALTGSSPDPLSRDLPNPPLQGFPPFGTRITLLPLQARLGSSSGFHFASLSLGSLGSIHPHPRLLDQSQ